MGKRLELHKILEEALGSNHVYFQPPESMKLVYPCIVYSRVGMSPIYANNKLYCKHNKYQVTVIDKSPVSEIPDRIFSLPFSSFSNHFTSDGLNHDVFNIYY